MFGAGGGTSSYREVEETDLIVLWGSNARETHPIFFHHLLRGVRNGARLLRGRPAPDVVGRVGGRLARARRRQRHRPGQRGRPRDHRAPGSRTREFIDRATVDFEAYRAKVESYTLEYAERETGVPAEAIRELAHAYATAPRAMICWTLGITEHHNAVDNVLALINLVAADRPRRALRQRRQPAARPEQRPGRRRHGRPARPAARASSTSRTTRSGPSSTPPGACRSRRSAAGTCPAMFDAMERGELTGRSTCIGENPVQSEADQASRDPAPVRALDFLVVQDLFLTTTAELADVVLPGQPRRGPNPRARSRTPSGASSGSARRVEPPGEARDDLCDHLRARPPDGRTTGARPIAETVWNEVRSAVAGPRRHELRPARGARRASSGRAATRPIPASCSSTRGSGRTRCPAIAVPFVPVDHDPPVDRLDDDFPIRLTTGRRLDSLQHRRPDRRLHLAAAPRRDASTSRPRTSSGSGSADGERVRVVSRRGQVEVPVRVDDRLRPGLTFMTLHFQDDVATNLLTIDATDPKSGTAEFKATAIRIEKLEAPIPV